LNQLNETYRQVEKYDQSTQLIPTAVKHSIWYKLVSIIRDIGMRIKDLRELLLVLPSQPARIRSNVYQRRLKQHLNAQVH
jgi:hypothetical protein